MQLMGAAAKSEMRMLTSFHLIDTYTRSKVHVAEPLNPNVMTALKIRPTLLQGGITTIRTKT